MKKIKTTKNMRVNKQRQKEKNINHKRRSIKQRLIIAYTSLLFIGLLGMAMGGTVSAKNGMKEVQNLLTYNKLNSDVAIAQHLVMSQYGHLELVENDLVTLDKVGIKGNHLLVDNIKKSTGDISAILVKEDEGFTRIATNIQDENRNRIVGTRVEADSVIYETLMRKETYIGETNILEKDYLSAYTPIYNNLNEIIGALFVGVPIEESQMIIEDKLTQIENIFMGLFFIFVIVGVGGTYLVATHIAKPLKAAIDYTNRLSQLELVEEVPKILMSQKDELGTLGQSLNSLKEELTGVIQNSEKLSTAIKNKIVNLKSVTGLFNETAKQINQVVDQIAVGATSQASETQIGVNTISELEHMLIQSGTIINDLSTFSKEVETLKNEGIESAKTLYNEAAKTKQGVSTTQTNMIEVQKSTQKITAASEKIKEISNQTALLALNAAIEAARTGESGRGFAVIATEIRKLAEQADKFAEEIHLTIKDLGENTTVSVESMNSLNEFIETQNNNIKMTYQKFEGIAKTIEVINKSVDNLLDAQGEMNRQRETMVEAIHELSSIAEENAAATEEVASSLTEQTDSIEQIYEDVKDIDYIADELQIQVDKFNL